MTDNEYNFVDGANESAYTYNAHEAHRMTADAIIAAILAVITVVILAATVILVAVVLSWT